MTVPSSRSKAFAPFDVVVVPFPYADRLAEKRRPAVVVNAPALHILETMRRIGRLAGLAAGEYKPSIVLPPEAGAWFRQNYPGFDQPFIFLNVSATSPERARNERRSIRSDIVPLTDGVRHEAALPDLGTTVLRRSARRTHRWMVHRA